MKNEKSSPEQYRLQIVLRNVSRAMRDLGEVVSQLETSVLEANSDIQGRRIDPISMQQFDLVIQSVDEIGLLLDRMSTETDVNAQIDYGRVIAPTRLEKLRDLVGGSDANEAHRLLPHDASGVSLF